MHCDLRQTLIYFEERQINYQRTQTKFKILSSQIKRNATVLPVSQHSASLLCQLKFKHMVTAQVVHGNSDLCDQVSPAFTLNAAVQIFD